jgi:ubiquinone/menaquinone biosynthesis C-methylase UbiE
MTTDNPYREIHVKALQEFIKINGKTILVIGVGNGEEAYFLLADGAKKVYGVDIFIPKTIYTNPDFHVLKADSENLPFANETIDIVFSHATFEHIKEIENSFVEIQRVLKPNGICYVVASPLWFSEQGHHRSDLFSHLPWFHVFQTETEMLNEYLEHLEDEAPSMEHLNAIKWIGNTSELNRHPVERYINATRKLVKMKRILLKIDEGNKPVPEKVLNRTGNRISMQDLNAWTFLYVARKRSRLDWWIWSSRLRSIRGD